MFWYYRGKVKGLNFFIIGQLHSQEAWDYNWIFNFDEIFKTGIFVAVTIKRTEKYFIMWSRVEPFVKLLWSLSYMCFYNNNTISNLMVLFRFWFKTKILPSSIFLIMLSCQFLVFCCIGMDAKSFIKFLMYQ